MYKSQPPDDEALLPGGTLAQAAEAGPRVVIVTATDGSLGLTSRTYDRQTLGQVRLGELRESAALLLPSLFSFLFFSSLSLLPSFLPSPPFLRLFVLLRVAASAERGESILRAEAAELRISYDVKRGSGLCLIHLSDAPRPD